MTTPRTRYHPPLTEYLVSRRIFAEEPFSLIDVGASGGIETHWEVFGGSLTALGFEPLIAETNRLNAGSPSNIRYEAAFVTSRERQTAHAAVLSSNPIKYRDNRPFPRTSAARAQSLRGFEYATTFYDPSGSGVLTATTVSLDEVHDQRGRLNVDFLKIDTDGHDYYALRGGQRMLSDAHVLGVFIECSLHGPLHHRANLFSNIDRFLRAKAFSLFDIEAYRCSRGVLPKPFLYRKPANTRGGQVVWGEVLYVRDVGDPEYEKKWQVRLSEVKLCKLACIFEIHRLEDCAAEVLLTHRGRLERLIDVERCLDLLTPRHRWRKLTFRQYNDRFEKQLDEWYPGKSGEIWRGAVYRLRRAADTVVRKYKAVTQRP